LSEAHSRIIVLGPPNSGKGELARRLSKVLGIEHLFIAKELLSRASSDGNGMTKYMSGVVNAAISDGVLVTDDIVVDVINNTLVESRSESWVLSGAPGTLHQAEIFESLPKIGQRQVIFLILQNFDDNLMWQLFQRQDKKRNTLEIFHRQRMCYLKNSKRIERFVQAHRSWRIRYLNVGEMSGDDLLNQALKALDVQIPISTV